MRKEQNIFIPNCTEIKRAASHLRKLQKSTDNYFRCEYYPATGRFRFTENTDPFSYTAGPEDYVYVSSEVGIWEKPEEVQKEIRNRFLYKGGVNDEILIRGA